ncbi:hypothetical protein ACFZAT_27330 [Streptomyces sp. NPDC008163]|uniref:hypothetical protein n=1 Tax=Streptomyces sp. NPDC008163 TaxID=3364818 RepID=UPI0036E380B2
MRGKRKFYALGLAVAAALAITACEPGGGDGDAGGAASPSASAPGSPSTSAPASPSPAAPPSNGGSGWQYEDRQTPPEGSVCDHGGQGPYGSVESVSWGGESPTVMGLVFGMYECDGSDFTFQPTSATGAATQVRIDTRHLKVVLDGALAKDIGTKTPSVDLFLDRMAAMQDNGQLKGRQAPQFYFRTDVPDDDPNSLPDDEHQLIYLYQIIGGK